jgi:hypothetical protein
MARKKPVLGLALDRTEDRAETSSTRLQNENQSGGFQRDPQLEKFVFTVGE